MHTTSNVIKTIFSYIFWTVGCCVFVPLLLPLTLLSQATRYDNRLYHFIAKWWAHCFIKGSFVRFSVKGLENIPEYPNQPSLVLMNHTSALDIPFAEILFKHYPHIWLANDYRNIPFFGTLLSRMHIVVQRQDVSKLVNTLRRAYALLKDKPRHLFLFPEGTRHHDGYVHEFFTGYVMLAEKLQRPVIPVAFYGLHKILPKRRFMIDSSACPVKISIGKPLYYADYGSRQEFAQVVHDWFKNEVEQLKKD